MRSSYDGYFLQHPNYLGNIWKMFIIYKLLETSYYQFYYPIFIATQLSGPKSTNKKETCSRIKNNIMPYSIS